MDADTTQRVRRLFEAAQALDGVARVQLLDEQCASDATLRARVETLLAAAERAGTFLETPAFASNPTLLNLPQPERLLGTTVGRYTLMKVIGEGGMGVVYKAQQESPARVVAVKVLRWALADQESVARFHFEVESLGKLRHPGIAHIIEAGVHRSGEAGALPYFAMEYVPDAKSLVEYMNHAQLDRRCRVQLLIDICAAVHHGHINGVVHCDLKPANILVDGSGCIRIIDLGISRTLDRETEAEDEDIRCTRAGTAQYMSPEQCARGSAVDTRTDVYSLGVVFYESLTGELPYATRHKAFSEATQTILTSPPRRPSMFDSSFPRDLEAVLLKALEKNPANRYESASELGAELTRWLSYEPVVARPVGIVHYLKLLSRRNRSGTVAAIVVSLVVLAAAVASGWMLSRLQAQRETAAAKSRLAMAFDGFVRDLVDSANPVSGDIAALTVLDLLAESDQALDRQFANDPITAAGLHSLIGYMYLSLARTDRAEFHLSAAWTIYVEFGLENSNEGLNVLYRLAQLDSELSRFDVAINRMQRVVDGFARSGNERESAWMRHWLANICSQAGLQERALEELQRSLETLGEVDDPKMLFAIWNTRGLVHYRMGERVEGNEAMEKAIGFGVSAHGEISHQVAGAKLNLANGLRSTGDLEGALQHVRSARASFIEVEGAQSRFAVFAGITEAGILQAGGQFSEAIDVAESTYSALTASYDDQHPQVLLILNNLAHSYLRTNQLSKSLDAATRAVQGFTTIRGPEHLDTLRAKLLLSRVFTAMSRGPEAVGVLRSVVQDGTLGIGPAHPITREATYELFIALSQAGAEAEATQLGEMTLASWISSNGWEDESTQELAEALENLYDDIGRTEDAARIRASRPAEASLNRN